jgi:hypothetical protein
MSLQGAPELLRRIRAIKTIFRTAGAAWQDETSRYARAHIPVRTGATRASVRGGTLTGTRAKVVGKYTVNFIDAGSKAHDEPRSRFTKTGRLRRGKAAGTGKVLKFQRGGQTMFRRKVSKRAIAARPFKKESGREGLRKVALLDRLIKLWNEAA